MTESKNNTHGQRGAPEPFLDDYLPDSSPRPKYVIATIYPPSREPLAVPDRKPGSATGEIPVPIQSSRESVSKAFDAVLPASPERGAVNTTWKEASLGIPSGRVAGAGSGSADSLMRPLVPTGSAGPRSLSSSGVSKPSAKENLPLMELPRGRFRALKRNTSLIALLHTLHTHAFRGSCRINRNGSAILLVFDQGKIILAEYDSLAGDAALDMICTHRSAKVDAIISDLDDAQIRLSLEFNPSWRVNGNQELSCIVEPGRIKTPGRKSSLGREAVPGPEPEKYMEPAPALNIRPVNPVADSPAALGKSPDAEETAGEISTPPRQETAPVEQGGLAVPDGADTPDWRKALAMPLVLTRDDPVPSTRPEPELHQAQEGEVDWRKALTTPLIPRQSGKAVPMFDKTDEPENRGEIEGWKRALHTPVIPALPEENPSAEHTTGDTSRISAGIPDFEPLFADSGLFDDVPVERKMPKRHGPEPAEQWKSMGMNRGENSSV